MICNCAHQRGFRFSGILHLGRCNSISRRRLSINLMTACNNSGSQRGHHSKEYFPMRLTKLVLATAVSAVVLVSAPGAFAQRNNAASDVVVNYQRVIGESAMGRDMSTKLQGVGAQIQQQAQAMQSEGQAIETEEQRLQTATRGMTPAQVRANSTLTSQIQALQTRAQQFQTRRQALQ